jgi:flagellar biosynthesis protein FliR
VTTLSSLQSIFLANAAAFGLVGSRVTGFVVVSPFPGQNVSATQRATVVVAVAWAASAYAPVVGVGTQFDLALAARAALEVACGLVIGVAFRVVFSVAEVVGTVLSHATGLSSPSVLNPTIESSDSILDRIVTLLALLVALAAGMHRVALGALLESFRALPVGLVVSLDAPMLPLVDVAVDAFVAGVRLGIPVVAVALLVQLSLALISRAAPSLQIFSIGFALLFTTGIGTFMAGLDDFISGLVASFSRLAPALDSALTAMRR